MAKKSKKKLSDLVDKEFSLPNGWLCPRGDYYSCGNAGHNAKMAELGQLGYQAELNTCETGNTGFIKIRDPRNYGGGQHIAFGTYVEKITPRQKLALEEIIRKHNLIKPGEFDYCGYLIIERSVDGKVSFRKRKDDETDGIGETIF